MSSNMHELFISFSMGKAMEVEPLLQADVGEGKVYQW